MAKDDKYALRVTGCTFGGTGTAEDAYALGNKAKRGGAIWHVTGNVKGENCDFISNKVSERGGALFVAGGRTVSFEGGKFERNYANIGGAMQTNVALTITGMTFTKNTAPGGGPAIRNNSDKKIVLNGCTIDKADIAGQYTINP